MENARFLLLFFRVFPPFPIHPFLPLLNSLILAQDPLPLPIDKS